MVHIYILRCVQLKFPNMTEWGTGHKFKYPMSYNCGHQLSMAGDITVATDVNDNLL